MSAAVAVRIAVGLLLAVGSTGCGRDVVVLDKIPGKTVGTMAERELETENPRMAAGTLSCPDLEFRAGASVRCLRTAQLSEGRVVKVQGIIEVTSLASGGKLHVTMADDASEFGVSGDHLAADLSQRYLQRFHSRPSQVDCPYLRGAVGATVTCRVRTGAKHHDVDVEVTAVDPKSYRTTYVTRPHR